MTDSKQAVVLNLAPTIDQINADRITQVHIIKIINDKQTNTFYFEFLRNELKYELISYFL